MLRLAASPRWYLYSTLLPDHLTHVEHGLQLDEQLPLFSTDFVSVELFQRVNTCPANERVQRVFLFELSAVQGLIGTFDFDRNGGLAPLDEGNGFVVALY